MSLQFDEVTLNRLESLYKTADAQQRRHAVLEALKLRTGERVLDIGTGAGFLANEIADAVSPSGQVLGVDNSEAMLDAARRRCADKPWVRFEAGDATRLPVAEGGFDAAVSVQVYEYVHDVERALAELKRVLRAGGRSVVVATDWDGIVWRSGDETRMNRVLTAFRGHCAHSNLPRTLAGKLRKAGLELAEQKVIPQFNPSCGPENYSYHMIGIIRDFVLQKQLVSESDVADWEEDLYERARSGEYFFCLNQYLFVAIRP